MGGLEGQKMKMSPDQLGRRGEAARAAGCGQELGFTKTGVWAQAAECWSWLWLLGATCTVGQRGSEAALGILGSEAGPTDALGGTRPRAGSTRATG